MENEENTELIEFIEKTVHASTKFEVNNDELKKQYILSNVILYNSIAHSIDECKGTFGTGYPFYALKPDLSGALPIINEQLRYNNELIEAAKTSKQDHWACLQCLQKNGITMENLKSVCIPCPNIEDALKPRKVINRLPDLDLWTICDEEQIAKIKAPLQELLSKNGFTTSDVDPIHTINDVIKIVESLQTGKIPAQKLPIDTHIIDAATLYTLVYQIPSVLDECAKDKNKTPYLPIHPLSLRKVWQKDDTAYNFVHDFFCSFTPFNMDPKMKNLVDEVRQYVAQKYDFETLYQWTKNSGTQSTMRRFETPTLKKYSYEKFNEWQKGPVPNPLEKYDDGGMTK